MDVVRNTLKRAVVLFSMCYSFLSENNLRANNFPPQYDDATLHAIQFVDRTEGWAVGDQGVVWHSVDGGLSWERQKSGSRANLRSVHFLTPYFGFAAGQMELPGLAKKNIGVLLVTTDGGLNWTERGAGLLSGIKAVRFFDDQNGIVICETNEQYPTGIYITKNGGISWKELECEKGVKWNSFDFQNATKAVFAGQGKVAFWNNGQYQAAELPEQNWISAKFMGDKVLLASRDEMYLSSADQKTFQQLKLPEKFCTQSVSVVGEFIVAVGMSADETNKNSVLISRDAGQTWTVTASPLPIGLNAASTLNETESWAVGELGNIIHTHDGGKSWQIQKSAGQRCSIVVVGKTAESLPYDLIATLGMKQGHYCLAVVTDENSNMERLLATVRAVGGATAKKASTPQELQTLLAHYQPETVICTDEVSLKLIDQAKVSNLFACQSVSENADITFSYLDVDPSLANRVTDFCDIASLNYGLTAKVPVNRFLKCIKKQDSLKANELVNDVAVARGGTARRKYDVPKFEDEYLEARNKYARARRTIDKIVADPAKSGSPEKALTEIRDALVSMSEDEAVKVASMVANQFYQQGQWGYAREVHSFIVESFAEHNEAAESIRWLLRFHASAEVNRRIELGQVNPVPMSIFDKIDEEQIKAASSTTDGNLQKISVMRFKTGETFRRWNRMALDYEPKLASFGPAIAADPATIRYLVISREQLGIAASATTNQADKKQTVSKQAKTKPVLDGKFDEECWATDNSLAVNIGKENKTIIKISHDDQFVYFAISANHAKGQQKEKVKVRERDADLSEYDRIDLELDLSQGGDTPYCFSVDQRGCLRDSCWGDLKWDPKWFVAFESTETNWQAEIAIPVSELTKNKIAGSSWGIQIKRTSPKVGTAKLTESFEHHEVTFAKE